MLMLWLVGLTHWVSSFTIPVHLWRREVYFFSIFIYLFSIYFKAERERVRERSPILWFIPQTWFSTAKAGLAQSQGLQTQSGLPHGEQEPKELSCCLLPPRVHISRKLESEGEAGFSPICDGMWVLHRMSLPLS